MVGRVSDVLPFVAEKLGLFKFRKLLVMTVDTLGRGLECLSQVRDSTI